MQEHRQLGERIAQARRARGLAQRELAAQLGVTERTVQNYESGASPPHRHLHEIERATGASHAWVLYGDETGTPLTERAAGAREAAKDNQQVLAHLLETLSAQTQLLRDQLDKYRK